MKREILFKAKRIDNGEWIEGDLITFVDYSKGIRRIKSLPNGYRFANSVEVDPSTVCQYTGLRDKNGVKIFEGDTLMQVFIVKWSDSGKWLVIRDDKKFDRYDIYLLGDMACVLGVTGNIHDKESTND